MSAPVRQPFGSTPARTPPVPTPARPPARAAVVSTTARTQAVCVGHRGVPLHRGTPSRGVANVVFIGPGHPPGTVRQVPGTNLGVVDTRICQICGGILR